MTFAVRCSGTDCGRVWCVPQKLSQFDFGARYSSDGLNLSINGTIESATASTRNVHLLLHPGGFEIRANVPWSVLPYLFDRTPPFFEKHRQTVKALSSN